MGGRVGNPNLVRPYRLAGVGYVKDGAQYYDREDLQGSSILLQDASGAYGGFTAYDAWGRERQGEGTNRSDLRFKGSKGYVTDEATGMLMPGATG